MSNITSSSPAWSGVSPNCEGVGVGDGSGVGVGVGVADGEGEGSRGPDSVGVGDGSTDISGEADTEGFGASDEAAGGAFVWNSEHAVKRNSSVTTKTITEYFLIVNPHF
jgi:hypothetical protein